LIKAASRFLMDNGYLVKSRKSKATKMKEKIMSSLFFSAQTHIGCFINYK